MRKCKAKHYANCEIMRITTFCEWKNCANCKVMLTANLRKFKNFVKLSDTHNYARTQNAKLCRVQNLAKLKLCKLQNNANCKIMLTA